MYFENELNLIADDSIRKITQEIIEKVVPPYFFEVAASSTGKYHPDYALGEGGLYRHTCAAVKIADSLFETEDFCRVEKDYIIAALILHDSFKHGVHGGRYTKHEHPLIAAEEIINHCKVMIDDTADEYMRTAYTYYADMVPELIGSHMGKWTTSNYSSVVLPKPILLTQKFVHVCDYLASRKFLEVKLDD